MKHVYSHDCIRKSDPGFTGDIYSFHRPASYFSNLKDMKVTAV